MSDHLRYDATIDPKEPNTSHSLVLELVGRNRRVLDVGCATGRLGEILVERGCTVVGLELDAAAAELARTRLSEVLVADITGVDFVERFAADPFDVVILADVLEHVPDPEAVLRQIPKVLRAEGFVVVSVPNIAHGAVRLALLQGRFVYTDVGLLDATHLRFFTRDAIDELLSAAGLTAVDVRRTTAGLFETEIAIDRARVDQAVVEGIEREPEATTYQFVVKAVRDDAHHAVRDLARRHEEQVARVKALERELDDLRRRGRTGRPGSELQVGVWSTFDLDPQGALRAAIYEAELARRMPGASIRLFAPVGARRERLELPMVLEPLRSPSDERLDELAGSLDAAVLTGAISARFDRLAAPYGPTSAPAGHPAAWLGGVPLEGRLPTFHSAVQVVLDPGRQDDLRLLDELRASQLVAVTDDRTSALLAAEGTRATVVPEPLVLAHRVQDRIGSGAHRALLRAGGRPLDGSGYVVIHGGGEWSSEAALVAQAVARLAADRDDLCVVSVNVGGVAGEGEFSAALAREAPEVELVDDVGGVAGLLALLVGAELVVSSEAWVRDVVEGAGRPALELSGPLGRFGDRGALLAAIGRPPTDRVADVAAVDAHFDDLAAALTKISAGGDAVPRTIADRFVALERARAEERSGWADIAGALADRARGSRAEVHQLELTLEALEAAVAQGAAAAAELDALRATRTFQSTRRIREAYARVRRLLS